MRLGKLLTTGCLSQLLMVTVVVSFLSVGCGGSETASGSASTTTGSVTLSWQAPSTNEDGSPLTGLVGYRVYYSEISGIYTNSELTDTSTTYRIVGLGNESTVYISVTAVTVIDGIESESFFSNEVSVYIPVV